MISITSSHLKKISFKRNKKDPTIEEADISRLKLAVSSEIDSLVLSGLSKMTSVLEAKTALVSRATEISQMKDSYKSYSKKDNYVQFLDNLIQLHLSVSEEIN